VVTVDAVDDAVLMGGDISGNGVEDNNISGTLAATDVDGLTDGTYFTVSGAAASGVASI